MPLWATCAPAQPDTMPEPGFRPPSVPGSYRLVLALSLAFLAHTLLFAGLPSPIQDQQEFSHRLVFRLSTPTSQANAATPARPAVPDDTSDRTQPRNPNFTVASDLPEIVTESPNNRTVARPTPAVDPPAETPAEKPPSRQANPATPVTAA